MRWCDTLGGDSTHSLVLSLRRDSRGSVIRDFKSATTKSVSVRFLKSKGEK